jgi:hypothetical protein
MTRSRTKTTPNQYTSIPFPLKALKLVLKDVQASTSSQKGKSAGGVSGQKTGGGDADIEEDDGVSVPSGYVHVQVHEYDYDEVGKLITRTKSGMTMIHWLRSELKWENSTSCRVSCLLVCVPQLS